MPRIDVTQATVLEGFIDRLRDVLALDQRNCYEVSDAQDLPSIPPGGDYFLTVAPGEGSFPPEEQAAGNITEEFHVTVTIYTRVFLDSTDHDQRLLVDDARGLLVLKGKVLHAMCGHDLKDEDDNYFLRQLVHALSAGRPEAIKHSKSGNLYGRLAIVFGTPFDWDITA